MGRISCALWCALGLLWANGSAAEPIVASDDAQVIETLPASTGPRGEARRLRRALAAQPGDPAAAVALARHQLDLAREQGDPRPAGQALAVLQGLGEPASAAPEVLLMLATVQQYLHQFDEAIANLERATQRQPRAPQAWLTLATLHRVQGRYDASDQSCRGVAAAGAALHAAACRAENDALRGMNDSARATLTRLVQAPRIDAATRNWLWTTLAELEQRAGRETQAEAAYQAALQAMPDGYTALAYADLLLQQRRDASALKQLEAQPATDAVLLRRAIAMRRLNAPQAEASAQELRERILLANQRPQAQAFHAREQAMFALEIETQPQRSLELARLNVARQREPLDLLLMARAARAAGDPNALNELRSLRESIGLRDARVDALL